jgi:hypothetical protein
VADRRRRRSSRTRRTTEKSQDFAGCYGFCDLSAFASRLDCLSPQLKIKQVAVPQWAYFTGWTKRACGQARTTCILRPRQGASACAGLQHPASSVPLPPSICSVQSRKVREASDREGRAGEVASGVWGSGRAVTTRAPVRADCRLAECGTRSWRGCERGAGKRTSRHHLLGGCGL